MERRSDSCVSLRRERICPNLSHAPELQPCQLAAQSQHQPAGQVNGEVQSVSLLYPHSKIQSRENLMNEQRKYAILFAATILSARKLLEMEADKPNATSWTGQLMMRPSSSKESTSAGPPQ